MPFFLVRQLDNCHSSANALSPITRFVIDDRFDGHAKRNRRDICGEPKRRAGANLQHACRDAAKTSCGAGSLHGCEYHADGILRKRKQPLRRGACGRRGGECSHNRRQHVACVRRNHIRRDSREWITDGKAMEPNDSTELRSLLLAALIRVPSTASNSRP